MSTMARRVANSVYSDTIVSNTRSENATRSILLMAISSRGIPRRDAMKEWRLVWVRTPRCASMSRIARFAEEAPVTMLRVYCSWPGVSARMKWRFAVEK